MTSLLPPQYLSRADLERCSSVRISRYIISVPSRYSCNSVLRIYLFILSHSRSVRSPTSDLRTPYSGLFPSGLDFGSPSARSSANRGHRRCLRALVNNFAEALTRVRRTPDRNPGTPDSARHSPNSYSLNSLDLMRSRVLFCSFRFHTQNLLSTVLPIF